MHADQLLVLARELKSRSRAATCVDLLFSKDADLRPFFPTLNFSCKIVCDAP
jgi:hypothetical protein